MHCCWLVAMEDAKATLPVNTQGWFGETKPRPGKLEGGSGKGTLRQTTFMGADTAAPLWSSGSLGGMVCLASFTALSAWILQHSRPLFFHSLPQKSQYNKEGGPCPSKPFSARGLQPRWASHADSTRSCQGPTPRLVDTTLPVNTSLTLADFFLLRVVLVFLFWGLCAMASHAQLLTGCMCCRPTVGAQKGRSNTRTCVRRGGKY